MKTLGTLCKMQEREFDRSADGVRAEGRRVTDTIRRVLESRWKGEAETRTFGILRACGYGDH